MSYEKEVLIKFNEFSKILCTLTSAEVRVLCFIIENMTETNELTIPQKEIADTLEMSKTTVNMAFNKLRNSDPPFLSQLSFGLYEINPKIVQTKLLKQDSSKEEQ